MFDLKELIFENRKLSEQCKELKDKIAKIIEVIESGETVVSPTVQLMKIKGIIDDN